MSIDVADWLRRLGLEQYAPAFADNDIDGEILPELTADDLIGIGVTSIGHRRRLFNAITALDNPQHMMWLNRQRHPLSPPLGQSTPNVGKWR